jgi:hypothetical protein
MQPILLKPLLHRGAEQIGICFAPAKVLNALIKKVPSVKWSQTHKCWYKPLNNEIYHELCKVLNGVAPLDINLLKDYLEKKKKHASTLVSSPKKDLAKPLDALPAWKLGKENLVALEKFVEQLKLKAYSVSTIRTYRNEFLQLLKILKNKYVADLTVDDIKRYMVFAMEKQGISENTAHSRLNALKFYFEQVLGREKFFWRYRGRRNQCFYSKC